MALDADEWLDRQKLKQSLLKWRIAGLVLSALLVIAFIQPWDRFDDSTDQPHVAVLALEGVLQEDPELIEALDRAQSDDAVRALIIQVNSPGSTFVGGESLYNAILRVGAKKPVVAEMGTLATSGGYMVSLAADRIFAHQGTVTGSIGVIMQMASLREALANIGIHPKTYRSGPLKAQPNVLEDPTPEVDAATMRLIDDMHDLFVDMVAARRPFDRATAQTLADGRVFTGRQALQAKLIDAIGGRVEARDWLAVQKGISKDLPAFPLEIERDDAPFLLREFRQTVGKILSMEGLTLDGIASVWHPDP